MSAKLIIVGHGFINAIAFDNLLCAEKATASMWPENILQRMWHGNLKNMKRPTVYFMVIKMYWLCTDQTKTTAIGPPKVILNASDVYCMHDALTPIRIR